MNPEYRHTRFLASPPAGGFPTRFGVVTACNPNGVMVAEDKNAEATSKLFQQLQNAGRTFFPVTGCSPDLSHQEPGFGLVCHTAEEVLELGRAWEQEAVFWVEDGILHLLGCNGECRAPLGRWETRVQPLPSDRAYILPVPVPSPRPDGEGGMS